MGCYEKIGDYEKMADAGRSCVKADKNFVKGYFRLATALKGLDDLQGCVKALESGLAIQSSNPDLERMMAKVKPKYEKMETARKAGLSGSEVHKEKGDEKYKAADFEGAVDEYTKCIEDLKKEGKELSPLAVKAHSNRAACYKQISNFDGVIEDCTAVLEIDPDNLKALIRRAQAFEGLERYRFALQDVKQVLGMPYNSVGKVNFDLCNGMQHRLQRTVNQLKAMS